jgi:hypothetical protein
MTFRKTIALSFIAMLASASAAMAATPHRQAAGRHHGNATEAQASYAAQARAQNQAGPYYYDASSNGSVWSYYPGYVPINPN